MKVRRRSLSQIMLFCHSNNLVHHRHQQQPPIIPTGTDDRSRSISTSARYGFVTHNDAPERSTY